MTKRTRKYFISDLTVASEASRVTIDYSGARADCDAGDGEGFNRTVSQVATSLGRCPGSWKFAGRTYAEHKLEEFQEFLRLKSRTDLVESAQLMYDRSVESKQHPAYVSAQSSMIAKEYLEFRIKSFLRSKSIPEENIEECFRQLITVVNGAGENSVGATLVPGNILSMLFMMDPASPMPFVRVNPQEFRCDFKEGRLVLEIDSPIREGGEIGKISETPFVNVTAKLIFNVVGGSMEFHDDFSVMELAECESDDEARQKQCEGIFSFLDGKMSPFVSARARDEVVERFSLLMQVIFDYVKTASKETGFAAGVKDIIEANVGVMLTLFVDWRQAGMCNARDVGLVEVVCLSKLTALDVLIARATVVPEVAGVAESSTAVVMGKLRQSPLHRQIVDAIAPIKEKLESQEAQSTKSADDPRSYMVCSMY